MKFKTTLENTKYEYAENIWTAKKQLKIDGEVLENVKKNQFKDKNGEIITLKGNFLIGMKLNYASGKLITLCQNKWYCWLLIFLPFLSMSLGIFGGALGGALSALFAMLGAYFNAYILRTNIKLIYKILLCVLVFAISFGVWFGIYLLIVGGIASAFPTLFS